MDDLVKTSGGERSPLFMFLVLALTVLFTVSTIHRNQQYRSALSLWQDIAQKSPSKPRVRLNLGRAYQVAGNGDAAIHEFQIAMQLAMATDRPKYERLAVRQYAAANMGEMFMSTDDPTAIGIAERIMSQVWNEEPGFPGIANNLAVIYSIQGRYQMAVEIVDAAMNQTPYYPWYRDVGKLHFNKASALKAMGHCAAALEEFRIAASQDRDIRDAGTQRCP